MNLFRRKRQEIVIAQVGDVIIINGVPYRVESERIRQMAVEPFYRSALSEAAEKDADNLHEKSK